MKIRDSNPFGGRPGFSPSPVTVVVQPGQEIRILVTGSGARLSTSGLDPDRSSQSPPPHGDKAPGNRAKAKKRKGGAAKTK
jgi:hypothetical protein